MRDALIADLALADLSVDGDRLLTEPMESSRDWTHHLARQLGWPGHRPDEDEDDEYWHPPILSDYAQAALLWLVRLIDQQLREWPPPQTPDDCQPMAEAATVDLGPQELYAMFLEGPARWRSAKEAGGPVESLPARLQPILEKHLKSALSQLFTRWNEMGVNRLKARRDEAIKKAERPKVPEPPPAQPRQPLTAQEVADRRKERGGFFQPPPRT